MAIDAKLAAGIAKVMAKLGGLTTVLTKDVPGAWTGSSRTTMPSPQPVKVTPFLKVTIADLRKDSTIKEGSSKVVLSPVGLLWEPEEGQRIDDHRGREWSVYKVVEVSGGEDVAAYVLYLTRGGREVENQ